MTRRRWGVLAAVGITVVLLTGCRDGSGDGPTTSSPSPGGGPSSSTPAPVTSTTIASAPSGAPVLRELQARVGSCVGAAATLDLTFTVADPLSIRVFTVVVDGAQTPAQSEPGMLTVDGGLPCDGGAHTVLVIATDENGRSGTQGLAVRAPEG